MKQFLYFLCGLTIVCTTTHVLFCAEKEEEDKAIERIAAQLVQQLSSHATGSNMPRSRSNSFSSKTKKSTDSGLSKVQRLRSFNFKSLGHNTLPLLDSTHEDTKHLNNGPLSQPTSPSTKRISMHNTVHASRNTSASFLSAHSPIVPESALKELLTNPEETKKYMGLGKMLKKGIEMNTLITKTYRTGAQQFVGCNLLKMYPTSQELQKKRNEQLDTILNQVTAQLTQITTLDTKILLALNKATSKYITAASRLDSAIQKRGEPFSSKDGLLLFNELQECLTALYQARSLIETKEKNLNGSLYSTITLFSYYPAQLLNILLDYRATLYSDNTQDNCFITHLITVDTDLPMQQYTKVSSRTEVLLQFAQELRTFDDQYAHELLTACAPFIQAQRALERTYKQQVPTTDHWRQYIELAHDLEQKNSIHD
ncbi:MAG: hypothetical protein WCE21_01190 [Candidatus Babeliales bacterium]